MESFQSLFIGQYDMIQTPAQNSNDSSLTHNMSGNQTMMTNITDTRSADHADATSMSGERPEQENHYEITIRRLQNEVIRLKAAHTEKRLGLLQKMTP